MTEAAKFIIVVSVSYFHLMILTASLLRGNHPLPEKQRICELIEFKTEITGQPFNQLHQLLGGINEFKAGIKAIRAHIRATPTTQCIEVDIARTFDFPGQLDSKLENAMGQQRDMTHQTQTFSGYIDDITNGFARLPVIDTEVVL